MIYFPTILDLCYRSLPYGCTTVIAGIKNKNVLLNCLFQLKSFTFPSLSPNPPVGSEWIAVWHWTAWRVKQQPPLFLAPNISGLKDEITDLTRVSQNKFIISIAVHVLRVLLCRALLAVYAPSFAIDHAWVWVNVINIILQYCVTLAYGIINLVLGKLAVLSAGGMILGFVKQKKIHSFCKKKSFSAILNND